METVGGRIRAECSCELVGKMEIVGGRIRTECSCELVGKVEIVAGNIEFDALFLTQWSCRFF
jgi:hypothetical protein